MLRQWGLSEEEAAWRASLESPHRAERCAFANPGKLFAFLQKRTGVHPQHTKPPTDILEPGP